MRGWLILRGKSGIVNASSFSLEDKEAPNAGPFIVDAGSGGATGNRTLGDKVSSFSPEPSWPRTTGLYGLAQ